MGIAHMRKSCCGRRVMEDCDCPPADLGSMRSIYKGVPARFEPVAKPCDETPDDEPVVPAKSYVGVPAKFNRERKDKLGVDKIVTNPARLLSTDGLLSTKDEGLLSTGDKVLSTPDTDEKTDKAMGRPRQYDDRKAYLREYAARKRAEAKASKS